MPCNLYGPNDRFHPENSHVIPSLIRKFHLSNSNIVRCWGDGTPLREFLYVDDLASAIAYIVENDINDDLINIGSNEEISIKELVENLLKIVDFKGSVFFNTEYPDGNPRKLLDSTKINNFGWKPEVSIDEGLTRTYKWYKENIS